MVPGLGARLNSALFQRGITRREFAVQAGVSHETLNQALNDRATRRTIARIERALGIRDGALTSVAPAVAELVREPTPAQPEPLVDADVEGVFALLASIGARRGLGPRLMLALLDGLETGARLEREPLPSAFWVFRRRMFEELIQPSAKSEPA